MNGFSKNDCNVEFKKNLLLRYSSFIPSEIQSAPKDVYRHKRNIGDYVWTCFVRLHEHFKILFF